jgi:fibronectin type 3 domain-containing protein
MGFVQTFSSPQNIFASDNHPSKVYVRWDKVEQAQYYIVYRSLSTSGLIPIDTVSGPVYIDTLLRDNETSAYYQVCAGFKTRIGMRSTTVKGTILLSPSSGTIYNQNDRAMVTWSSVSKAKLYKVYRSYGGQSNFSLIGSTQERFKQILFFRLRYVLLPGTSSSDSGESKSGLILTVNYLPGLPL